MKKLIMIEESLMEFAKRGRPRKNAAKPRLIGGIDSTDTWEDMDDEDDIMPDEINIDTSDMETADEIEVEEDIFDNKLFKALSNEIKIIEPNRRFLKFRLKGIAGKSLFGIPMAKIGNNAFLFKLKDGAIKKIFLRDIILENKGTQDKAKVVFEEINWHEHTNDNSFNRNISKTDEMDNEFDEEFDEDEIIDKLDDLAEKHGFEEADFEDEHEEDGIINIKRWIDIESDGEKELQLYKEDDENDNLSIFFKNGGYSGNDNVTDWLDDKMWESTFNDIDDEEDYVDDEDNQYY